MAEEQETTSTETLKPSIPTGRVKKIVKLDKDITRITSEALFLISGATELFLQFLAEESSKIAAEKKRKNVNLDHLRTAVKRHQPTRDFLLDSLPLPQSADPPPCGPTAKEKSQLPRNTRRIDSFFSKPPLNDDSRDEDPVGEDES